MMQLVFNHLTPALEDAQTLPAEKLPKLLADLREVECTALARLTAAAPAPASPDQLLTCKQAAAKLNCSRDWLYKNDLPFVRRLGRKRLYSSRGIDEYLARQK